MTQDAQPNSTTTRVITPAEARVRREPACVVVVAGAQLGLEARVDDNPLVIGRAEDCGLALSDSSVSRRHCRIVRDGDGYTVEDLGSTNHTFVNGEQITKFGLRDGDRLRVGHCELKFFGEGSAEATYHRELLNHAVFDGLTGFYNRRQSREMLEHAFDRGRREPGRLRVMILDLDHFKKVNDDYGHACGDHVLRETCRLAKSCVRKDDIVGRLGGEEFVILLPNADAAAGRELAERIRGTVEEQRFDFNGRQLRQTVSMGVAQMKPAMEHYLELLNEADRRLYESKRAGRNRVTG